MRLLPFLLLSACVGGDIGSGQKEDTGPDPSGTVDSDTGEDSTEDSDTGRDSDSGRDSDTGRDSDSGSDDDADGDGFPEGIDCDDGDPRVNPDAEERCNGVDDDCNGIPDDNAVDARTWYTDSDGDGFGDDAMAEVACDQPPDTSTAGGDCDDRDDRVNPDAMEVCDNRVDDDCNGDADDEDRACAGGGGDTGYGFPLWIAQISSPGGSFDAGIFDYGFWGMLDGAYVCEAYAYLEEGSAARTRCSGCDYEFNFEPITGSVAEGDYCDGLGMTDGWLDGIQIGLGWTDAGYWYLYYDGSWDLFALEYPEYYFYSTVYGEDGGYLIRPVYGFYWADYLFGYYRY